MDLSNVTSVDFFYILHLLFVAICKVLTLIQSAHPHKPAGPDTIYPRKLEATREITKISIQNLIACLATCQPSFWYE